jgi:DNA-binding MarR family transcriptional regulator
MAADDSRWLAAWMSFVRTHTRVWEQVESQMRRDHGLTMARYDVLAHLNLAGGRLGLSELAGAIALSPSGLSKLLDRMEASGLIRREPDPDDARAAFATITPRGRALVRSARVGHHALLRQTFGEALSDRDLADLTRIMKKLETTTRRPPDAATSPKNS